MADGGDRGFLYRASGAALLAMACWKLAGVGGWLAAKEELLGNREMMVQLAPLFLLGLFFLRGPLPAKKSIARVAGFQFLNLGFLLVAVLYGLAAVPLGAEWSGMEQPRKESDWAVRDRLRGMEAELAEMEKSSLEIAELPEGAPDSKKREAENKRQERRLAFEKLKEERERLAGELRRRGEEWEQEKEKERQLLQNRLVRAQRGVGGAAVLFILLGMHGLLAGFLYRGGGTGGGFPTVAMSTGKVTNSVPGALRPKRPVHS